MSTPRKAPSAVDQADAIIAAALRRAISTPHTFELADRGTSCARCSLGRYAVVHRADQPDDGPARPMPTTP